MCKFKQPGRPGGMAFALVVAIVPCLVNAGSGQQSVGEQRIVRTVHGTVDVSQLAQHSQPELGRRLLQAQSQRAAGHAHHIHPSWGPLNQQVTYLLSLGSQASSSERQAQLLDSLHQLGASVTSVLPPSTWVVTAGPTAAHWMSQLNGAVLAPYPPHLKLAPEWLTLARKLNMTEVAQQLYAAMQHDSTLDSKLPQPPVMAAGTSQPVAGASEDAAAAAAAAAAVATHTTNTAAGAHGRQHREPWLGSPRMHLKTQQQVAMGPGDDAVSAEAGQKGSKAASGASAARRLAQRDAAPAPLPSEDAVPSLTSMFLIDVVFPTLSSRDMRRLGLQRVNPHTAHAAFLGCTLEGICDARLGNGTLLPAYAAAMDWQQPLQEAAPHCGAEIVVERGRLMVAACQQDLVRVLLWLAAQPSVRWLAPHMQTKVQQADDGNVNAAAIIQAGQYAAGPSAALHPHWAAGINGTGQVVGSGDTGLDFDSCYFWDPSVPFSRTGSYSMGPSSDTVPAFVDPRHRKVIFYYAYGDYQDNSGHGSHTACTIAGSRPQVDLLGSPDTPTGMAPLAKIAYIDLSSQRSSRSNVILRPGNMVEDYYPWTYSQGARIHSDSWGSDGSVYDDACKQVDTFVWENPDFLPTFAAGNDNHPSNEPTIRSPALAKNAMAVGATLTLSAGDVSALQTYSLAISQPIVGGTVPVLTHNALLLASRGAPSWDALLGAPHTLAGASPTHGCAGQNPNTMQGRVMVAVRGTCTTDDKLRAAQAAGAIGLIITNNQEEGFFVLTLDGSVSPTIPLASVPLNTGRYLWQAANTSSAAASITVAARTTSDQAYDQLASFSSFGPSPDGRIKPDIVAPGMLISAGTDGVWSNDGQCSSLTETMQGTSMATPVVAGSAALVRQYFTDGYYPSGQRAPENAYASPSGALIRAVLMAGATPLKGDIESSNPAAPGFPVEPPPSVRQGWGRVDLSGSLPLAGDARKWHIQVIDKANLTTGQSHTYCVQATGGPLRVVLVYHDYPADLVADEKLVNDLGLEVRASAYGGLPMLGNNWNDTMNNVESVLLDDLPAGNVSISVTAYNVIAPGAPQAYALVVLGAFSGVLQSPNNPVGGGSTTSGSCVILLAVIDDSLSTSAPLLGTSDLNFYFGTASGTEAPRGFECSLTDNNGNVTGAPLHDWKACTSPTSYGKVPDGIYEFAVRTMGDNVATRRRITVDTTPPTTQVNDTVGLSSAAPGAPPPVTATPQVTFSMLAQDASPVTFKCLVQYSGPDGSRFRSLPPNNLSLSTPEPQPCTSPLTLLGLYYGDWSLSVTATDAANNVGASKQVDWKQQYKAGVSYARFEPATLPPALTNKKELAFQLYAFQGAVSGPPTPLDAATTKLEFRAWRTRTAAPTLWTAFTGPDLTVNANVDGVWQVEARVVGTTDAEAVAPATVMVDTQAPIIVIKDKPDKISSASIATVSFNTTVPDDTVVFECRWLFGVNTSTPLDLTAPEYSTTSVPFSSCNGTKPGMASRSVQDGRWLFQVRGTDLAGNVGTPQSVDFITDLDPPVITIITNPGSTTNRAINITYNVVDLGSDIANLTCIMRPTRLPDKPSGLLGPDPGWPFRRVNGTQEDPCPYPSALYSVKEGQYVFTLVAVDNAGLHTQRELMIVLDLQRPTAKVGTPIKPQGAAWPSTFAMVIQAVDEPKSGGAAGINHTDCMMSQVPAASGPSLLTVPNTNSSAGNVNSTSAAGVGQGGRRLQQSGPQLTVVAGGPKVPVAWDTWMDCGTSSQVTYEQFTSGYYAFKVRSTDNAGNVGNASDVYVFRVDDTLPLDPNTPLPLKPGGGGGGGSTSGMNGLAIGITVGVGLLLLAVILAVVVGLRKRARARHAMQAAAAAAHPQPLWQDPQHAALAQQQQWEQERVRRAIEASMEEENLRKALEASRLEAARQQDDARLQAAIRASLQQR